MDVGCTNDAAMDGVNDADVIYNLGADEIDIQPGAFVIYQGSHGDRGAHRADVILPASAFAEKSGTVTNTNRQVQMGRPAVLEAVFLHDA